MCVLVESSQQSDMSKTQLIWGILSDLYASDPTLSQLSEDRRKSHAAKLVVAAWKVSQSKLDLSQYLIKPEFVTQLEAQLASCHIGLAQKPSTEVVQQDSGGQSAEPLSTESLLAGQDVNAVFDLNFEGIDWSFWNSID